MNSTLTGVYLLVGVLLIAIIPFIINEIRLQNVDYVPRRERRLKERKAIVVKAIVRSHPETLYENVIAAWASSQIPEDKLPLYIQAGFTPDTATTPESLNLTVEELQVMAALTPQNPRRDDWGF
jgi:hypothetical protein